MPNLGAYLLDFYGSVAPLAKMTVSEAQANWPRELVVTWLNDGWARAVEDCGGLLSTSKRNLTSGQALYNLSAADLASTPIISLLEVILLKNGKEVVRLAPEYAPPLEAPAGTVTSSTPSRCSWKIQKHALTDTGGAIYELRLSPPPNWTETGALWIVCSIRPAEITADEASPDVKETMGSMGVAWACFKATRQPTFMAEYDDGRRLLMKSGLNNLPMTKRSMWRRGRSPNSLLTNDGT